MNVSEVMSKDLITVNKNDSISKVSKLMTKHNVRHIPVVNKKGALIGIVSDRDVREIFIPHTAVAKKTGKGISADKQKIKVADIMSEDLIIVSPLSHIEDAAKIFYELKIGCLPVVEGDTLLGIITETDILAVFIEMMGVLESSCRVDVLLDKGGKQFDNVCNIITKHDAHIISVGIIPSKKNGKRICFFRLQMCNMEPIVKNLKKDGYDVISVLK